MRLPSWVELGYLGGAGAVEPEHGPAVAGIGGAIKFVVHESTSTSVVENGHTGS